VTLGIQPSHPAVGFGYLEIGDFMGERNDAHLFQVKRFCEKPNFATAQQFVEAGNFFWNSGMFFWKNSTLFRAFERYMPELAKGVAQMRQAVLAGEGKTAIPKIFSSLERMSIDYGVMERSDNVVCLRTTFQWDDIGTWEAVARLKAPDDDGNTLIGNALALSCKDTIVYTGPESDAPLVAALGVRDLIVVASADAVMVCHKKDAQRVKEIVAQLKQAGRKDLT